MKRNEISVVIPTKNNADAISSCLGSLVQYQEQKYITEVIVVDGGSRDNTVAIASDFGATILRDEGLSPYRARELGWRQSKGDVILFMDADISLGSSFLPRALEFFNYARVGAIGCWSTAIVRDRTSKVVGQWWQYHGERLQESELRGSRSIVSKFYRVIQWRGSDSATVGGPCLLIRRSSLAQIGGFSRIIQQGNARQSGDIVLMAQLASSGLETRWWAGAPVFRMAPRSVRLLTLRYVRWGWGDYLMRRANPGLFSKSEPLIQRIGASLAAGLVLARRYREPLHIPLLFLSSLAWVVGYSIGRFKDPT